MTEGNYIKQLTNCMGVLTTIMQHCHDDYNLFFPEKVLLIQQFCIFEDTNKYIDYAQSVVEKDADGLYADVQELMEALAQFFQAYHSAEPTYAFRGFKAFFEDECLCVKRDYEKIDEEIERVNNQFLNAWDEPEMRKEKMDEKDPEYAAVCAECEQKRALYVQRMEIAIALRKAIDMIREDSRIFDGFELSHLLMFATELLSISRCIKADIVELREQEVV